MSTSVSKMVSTVSVAVLATVALWQPASAYDDKEADTPTAVEYRYTARFDKPVSGRLIAFNLIWECSRNRCHTLVSYPVPLLPACEAVVQVSGEVVRDFVVTIEKTRTRLTPLEIRKCNI